MSKYKIDVIIKKFSEKDGIPNSLIEWFLLDWNNKLALFDECGEVLFKETSNESIFPRLESMSCYSHSIGGFEPSYEEFDNTGRLKEIRVALVVAYRWSHRGWQEIYRELDDLWINYEAPSSEKLTLGDCVKMAKDLYWHYKNNVPYSVISEKNIPVFSSYDSFVSYSNNILEHCDFGCCDEEIKESIYDFIARFLEFNKWDDYKEKD